MFVSCWQSTHWNILEFLRHIFGWATCLTSDSCLLWREINFCLAGCFEIQLFVPLWVLNVHLWHLHTIINVIYNMTDLIVSCWRSAHCQTRRFRGDIFRVIVVVKLISYLALSNPVVVGGWDLLGWRRLRYKTIHNLWFHAIGVLSLTDIHSLPKRGFRATALQLLGSCYLGHGLAGSRSVFRIII